MSGKYSDFLWTSDPAHKMFATVSKEITDRKWAYQLGIKNKNTQYEFIYTISSKTSMRVLLETTENLGVLLWNNNLTYKKYSWTFSEIGMILIWQF